MIGTVAGPPATASVVTPAKHAMGTTLTSTALTAQPLPDLHVSRFGVIPKRHQPGKWRLILDLSCPAGHSVNDRIAGEDYSLPCMKVDDIAGIMRLGRGSLMAKFDVQNAYHIVPVHTEDRRLLGMKWRGAFYVDMSCLSASGQLSSIYLHMYS